MGNADVAIVPAHVARRPGRCRGRQPSPPGPCRIHPAGRRGDIRLVAARPAGPAAHRADRARGDGRGRRAGGAAADRAAARALAAQRPRTHLRPADVPPARPQGDGFLPRAHGRGGRHHPRERRVRQLSRSARQPVPDRLEVPRRAAPPVRTPAHARVPDEGRVLVRCRPRGPRPFVPRDVRRVPPRLRAVCAHVSRGRGRLRRHRRRCQP